MPPRVVNSFEKNLHTLSLSYLTISSIYGNNQTLHTVFILCICIKLYNSFISIKSGHMLSFVTVVQQITKVIQLLITSSGLGLWSKMKTKCCHGKKILSIDRLVYNLT